MICPNCGKNTPNNMSNCIYCGRTFSQSEMLLLSESNNFLTKFPETNKNTYYKQQILLENKEKNKKQMLYY